MLECIGVEIIDIYIESVDDCFDIKHGWFDSTYVIYSRCETPSV